MTFLRNKSIPLNAFMQELLFLLLGISAWYEYGEDGKRTDKILGYVYEVVDTMNFDRFRIKIKGQTVPLMSNEDLQELREKGEKVAVEFTEPMVTLYWSSTTKSLEDSFSAKDVSLVTEEL
ncbi:hypothetical protein [Blautia sp.]|uniref:hypothetical protein n=1 Tax=Blautia sp. TaxID=1955243 RepID=UPI0026129430|nr:hypothetical protein [Blautia sp.]